MARGDAALRGADRYGASDPKIEAWRRGLVVPPETVYDLGKQIPNARKALWILPDGHSAGAAALFFSAVTGYGPKGHARKAWQAQVSSHSEVSGSPDAKWIVIGEDSPSFDEPWLAETVQRHVFEAYMRNVAERRRNPIDRETCEEQGAVCEEWQRLCSERGIRMNPDERWRELERRAALGDPEARARLQAMQERLPDTTDPLAMAEARTRAAWEAYQAVPSPENRNAYMAERAILAQFRTGQEDAHEVAANLIRIHESQGPQWAARFSPDDMHDASSGQHAYADSPVSRMTVLDDPGLARRVLEAAQSAMGRPWNSLLWGQGMDPSYNKDGWARKKPTVAQAVAIVQAYYLGLGWTKVPSKKQRAKPVPPDLVSPDGQQRVTFSAATLRRERRDPDGFGGGAWVRDYRKDPQDQVGVIALARELVRRSIRAVDWRANPGRAGDQRFKGPIEITGYFHAGSPEAVGELGAAGQDVSCCRCGAKITHVFLTQHGPMGGDCLATLTGDNSTRAFARKLEQALKKARIHTGTVNYVHVRTSSGQPGYYALEARPVAPGKRAWTIALVKREQLPIAVAYFEQALPYPPELDEGAKAAMPGRRTNPFVMQGGSPTWVDARLVVYRSGLEVWNWEIQDLGEADKPAQVRQALRQAAELWRDSGLGWTGDLLELRLGAEVTRLTIAPDGQLVPA